MFCTNCGNKYEKGSNFCSICGFDLKNTKSKEEVKPKPAQSRWNDRIKDLDSKKKTKWISGHGLIELDKQIIQIELMSFRLKKESKTIKDMEKAGYYLDKRHEGKTGGNIFNKGVDNVTLVFKKGI